MRTQPAGAEISSEPEPRLHARLVAAGCPRGATPADDVVSTRSRSSIADTREGHRGEFWIESPDESTARFPSLTCAGTIARLSGTSPGSAIHPTVPYAHGRCHADSS